MPDTDSSAKPDDRSAGKSSKAAKSNGRSIVRTIILYVAFGLAAAAISGWYLFSYVPGQLEYFLGMRFRTLAIASAQLQSKAENLGRAVLNTDYVTPTKNQVYLNAVVPELKTTLADGLAIGEYTIAWSDLVAQASVVTQQNFDDLVLADEKGHVVWQREHTAPRIGSLPELLEQRPASTSGSIFSLQWSIQTTPLKVEDKTRIMPVTATSAEVNLDGRTSTLLTQPVTIQLISADHKAQTRTLFLAGIVSKRALQAEAMHVPTEWVVMATLPFVLVLLALPFIKLATVMPKERYGFGDVVLLGVCTVLITAIGGSLPFLVGSPASDSDASLRGLATAIEENLQRDASNFLDLVVTVKDMNGRLVRLAPCLADVPNLESVCDVWKFVPERINGNPQLPRGFAELDVVSWVDSTGMQTQKWTAKSFITPLIVQDYAHFRDIVAGRTWTISSREHEPFTIEPLRSPTTSDMAFVFAVPLGDIDADVPMLALNVKPQSVLDPLIPPGYGFAVLAPDGRVLFHSTSALSLEENFLRELSDPRPIVQAGTAGGYATWTGYYHGREHRFYAQPVSKLQGCPWKIVTFRELEPLLAFSASRQSAALVLFSVNIFVLLTIGTLYVFMQRQRGRAVKDVVMAMLIQSRHPAVIAKSLRWLGIIAVLMLLALVATYLVTPGWPLDVLFLVFIYAPVVALLVIGYIRHNAPRIDASVPLNDRDFSRGVIEMFLFVLILGAIPAAGMARLAHRADDLAQYTQWLKVSREQAVARGRRVHAAVQAAKTYTTDTKKQLLASGFASASAPPVYSYQSQLAGIAALPTRTPDAFTPYSPSWIERGLQRVRGLFASSYVDLPSVEVADNLSAIRLSDPEENGAHFAARYSAGGIGELRPWSTALGLAILAAAFFGIRWARHAFSFRTAAKTLSVNDAVRDVQAGGPNTAVLLIGPPRAEKDRLAAEAVQAVTGHRPEKRIRLLDVTLTRQWVDAVVAEVDVLLKTLPLEQGWLWIHVSNLEAQLVDVSSRTEVFRLFEKLLDRKTEPGRTPRPTALIVTSTIDPTAHFSEVFFEERQQVNAKMIPEVELNRSSLVLSRFRRCYTAPEGRSPWPSWYDYHPKQWTETLDLETSNHRLLADVATELKRVWAWRINDDVPMEELRHAIRVRAESAYQLLWASCTRSEKLVLIQLAQERLVNPKSRDTLDELIAKGLILPGPAPAIFNLTFRDFLRGIERTNVVQSWERMEGNGLWVVSGRLVASVLIIGGLFYLVTQGASVQSVLPLISGSSVLGIPLVRNIANLFASNKSSSGTLS
jgi:hypothetical protein